MSDHDHDHGAGDRPRPENEEKPRPGDFAILVVLAALIGALIINGGFYVFECLAKTIL
ncbi:MAG: hypothetical protein ACLFTV_06640 [Desulfococcaceae bacterium]